MLVSVLHALRKSTRYLVCGLLLVLGPTLAMADSPDPVAALARSRIQRHPARRHTAAAFSPKNATWLSR